MDKVYIYIIGLFFFAFSCGSNKIVADSNITPSDYPYINSFHQAIRLKIAGRNLESIKKLEYCLTIRNDDSAVYYLLSQLEFSLGNIDKSIDYIIKASEIDPDNEWYIEELAFMYYEIEEFEKSAEKFDDLVKLKPRNIELQYTYVEVLLKIVEYNKAIEDGAIIIDIRNHYESEVGRFKNAITPDVDRSEDLLPEVKKMLQKNKDDKILMSNLSQQLTIF